MEELPGSPSSEPGAEQAPSGRARPPSSPAVAEFQQTCREGLKPDLGTQVIVPVKARFSTTNPDPGVPGGTVFLWPRQPFPRHNQTLRSAF